MHVAAWNDAYAGLLPRAHLERRTVELRTASWQQYLRDDARVALVACEENGTVVGFASGGASRDPVEGYDAEIETLYVLPEAQGKRTGKLLLQAIAAELVHRGFRAAWVRVLSDNARARRFYEKCGARFLSEETEDIDDFIYREHFYGWPDLSALA